jgi:hypothetical protein
VAVIHETEFGCHSAEVSSIPKTLNVLLTVHHSIQYDETNVMHFSFNLLRIEGLYMSRALLVHPQEVLSLYA